MHLDRPILQEELEKLCDDWSGFCNFFCPCKILLIKEKRADGIGFRQRYDAPQTPFPWLLVKGVQTLE